jgi:PST family polysaccharide transporter
MHPIFQISNEKLRQNVQRAAVLNMAGRGVDLFFLTLGVVILARLLTPDDYGVFAMVTPFVSVVMIFGDLGLASAILQQRNLTEGQASALLRLNVLVGFILGAVFFSAAPLLSLLYDDARVAPVAAAMSLTFVFSGLTAVQRALLRRALRFGDLLRAEVAAAVVSLAVAISLALAGAGYWALTARALVQPFTYGIGVWLSSRWLPSRPEWDATTRSMIRYGKYFLAFSVLNSFGRQGDNVLIGWRYGSGELGPYALAYRIFLLPVQQITWPLGHVLIPAFSRLQDDPIRLKNWYLKTLRLMTFCAFPPLFSLTICAGDVVRVIAGPNWDVAAEILRWLAPIGALHVGYTTIGWLMQAAGRSDRNFYWGTIAVSACLAAFAIGLPWGASGVAAAYAIVNALLFLPGFSYGTKGTLIRQRDTLLAMLPCFITAGVTLPVVYFVSESLAAEWGTEWRLLLIGAAIAIIMAIGAFITYGPSAITAAGRDALALLRHPPRE